MKTPGSGHQSKARGFFPEILVSGCVALMIFLATLPSCKNDMQTIRSLEWVDTLPEMTANGIEILYSEKGRVQIQLVSPRLISKEEDEEPIMIFPDGFTVTFYDSIMNPTSTITADYGISYEKKKLMEARHNVVVENLDKKETLNTEELFWDRTKAVIYSDKFVRITSGGQVINGTGLFSREPFDILEVKDVDGVLEINEEPAR